MKKVFYYLKTFFKQLSLDITFIAKFTLIAFI